ncbi:hypothetical protein [Streptomyces sp. NPDC088785]|uniref:hypothetical protein n=1 Tax=Streptomyces sp. NPDC088785 TaxID=3365897 RepID=UPI0038145535
MRKLLVAGVLLVAAAVGCTAGGADGDAPKIPRTATGTLERIARRAGCDPQVQTDATDLRQATCGSGGGRYVLATFATDRGQAEWLDIADDYGGDYLVGAKWIVVGPDAVVTRLRGRLGGTVEHAASHHSGHH